MAFTEFLMVTDVRLPQLRKVLLPMVVTEPPMVTDVRPLQSAKALSPMVVTEKVSLPRVTVNGMVRLAGRQRS